MEVIKFKVPKDEGISNITEEVQSYVKKNRIKDGLVMLQTPEKTVALTFADSNDPNIEKDFLKKLNHFMPLHDGFNFTGWNTLSIRAAMVDQTLPIMVQDGCLILGAYQGIYAVDFKGPSDGRRVFISHLGTTLAEGEEPKMPKALTEYNEEIIAEETARREEEQRAIEEMRRDYADYAERLASGDPNLKSDRTLNFDEIAAEKAKEQEEK